MKRTLLLIALVVVVAACGRESKTPDSANAPSATSPSASAPRASAPASPAPAIRKPSTPTQCSGDGSYGAALDCFRSTAGFHFVITSGPLHADGDMTRPTPGAEKIRFAANGAKWLALAKASGIVWYRDGKRATSVPNDIDDIWQQTTVPFDPQKKEGQPIADGDETIDGFACNRFRFTDANSGDVHRVWVAKTTGDLMRNEITPLAKASKPLTMTLSKQGLRTEIAEPK